MILDTTVFATTGGQVNTVWTILDTAMEATKVVTFFVMAATVRERIHALCVSIMLILIPVVSVYVMNTGAERPAQNMTIVILMESQMITLILTMK